MKLHNILYILLLTAVFSACTKEPASLLDAPDYTYSDGEFTLVKWAGYRWAVVPLDEITEQYRFDIMLLDAEEADLDKIEDRVLDEFELIYTDETLPNDLCSSCMNDKFFPSDEYKNGTIDHALWCMDPNYDYTIRMYTITKDRGFSAPPTIIISIFNEDKLMDYCMKLENEE